MATSLCRVPHLVGHVQYDDRGTPLWLLQSEQRALHLIESEGSLPSGIASSLATVGVGSHMTAI
ncbi:MAG: hypothetical protein ACLPTZ_01385 [Beijerinckiaceae bacterium]